MRWVKPSAIGPLTNVITIEISRVASNNAIATSDVVPSATRAYEMPYDPYPWCAEYWDGRGGTGDCGFFTIEQCQASVSGVGGSCEPNQF
jgi:Protein of unknown function (DUF3551)